MFYPRQPICSAIPGNDDGFSAYIAMVPDEGVGVFLASNWDNTDTETVAYAVLDEILALENTTLATALEKRRDSPSPRSSSSE